ncbi:MAG: hypothetical protein E7561_06730 [Ruminococcaceae bacterium]|nr:hypothetical protein [Oscillospiraceae bacterium]
MYNYSDCTENGGCFRRCGCCFWIAAAILGAFLLATIGIILGAVFATAITGALSAVIVLAVSLLVMLITVLVIGICKCNR